MRKTATNRKWPTVSVSMAISLREFGLSSSFKECPQSATSEANNTLSLYVGHYVSNTCCFKGQIGKYDDSDLTVFQVMDKMWGGAKVGSRLFIRKIIQHLTNNNIRINFHVQL